MARRAVSLGLSAIVIMSGVATSDAGSEAIRTDALAQTDPAYQPGDTIPIRPGAEIQASALCASGRVLNASFWHTGRFGPTTPRTGFIKTTNDDVAGAITRFMVPLDTAPGTYPVSLQCVSGDATRYFTLEVQPLPQAEGTPIAEVLTFTYGSPDGVDLPNAITELADGGFAIVGATEGAIEGTNAGALDAWIAVFDADGTLRWQDQLGSTGPDEAVAVDQLSGGPHAGDIVVVGSSGGDVDGAGPLVASNGVDTWVQIRDVVTGAVEASTQVDGFDVTCQAAGDQFAAGVHALADGGFVLVGTTDTSIVDPGCIGPSPTVAPASVAAAPQSVASMSFGGVIDAFAIRFDDQLTRLWEEHYGTPGSDQARAVDVTADKLVITVLTDENALGPVDVGLVIADLATGSTTVASQFGGVGIDSPIGLRVVGTTIWLSGYSTDSPMAPGLLERPIRTESDGTTSTATVSTAWLTARSLADGSEQMMRLVDSSGDDCAGGLAVDDLDRVWAIGSTDTGLTAPAIDVESWVVVADNDGVVHADQFGGSGTQIAIDGTFLGDGSMVVVGGTGDVGCWFISGTSADVFVRIGSPAVPTVPSEPDPEPQPVPDPPPVPEPQPGPEPVPATPDAGETEDPTVADSTSSTTTTSTSSTVASEAMVSTTEPDTALVLPSTGSNQPVLPALVLVAASGALALLASRRRA